MGSKNKVLENSGGVSMKVVARPELEIQASQDGDVWSALEFRYKPGDVQAAPKVRIYFVAMWCCIRVIQDWGTGPIQADQCWGAGPIQAYKDWDTGRIQTNHDWVQRHALTCDTSLDMHRQSVRCKKIELTI